MINKASCPNTDPVNWQPISQMPLVAAVIDNSLGDTREHLETLTKARTQPHVLDDATIDRVERVHTEQMDFADIYIQQIERWRADRLSASQAGELDRMEQQNQQFRSVTADVLTLATELRKDSIDRVQGMSDLGLGLHALLRPRPSGQRSTHP